MSKRKALDDPKGIETVSKRQAKLAHNLRALNDQFASWVQVQRKDHLGELWTDGVEDYLKHAKGLLEEFNDVSDSHPPATALPSTSPATGFIAAPAASGTFGSTFGGPSSTAPGLREASSPTTSTSLFGGGASSNTSAPSSFLSAAPFTGFGVATSAVPTTGGFSFPPASTNTFSFTQQTTPAVATTTAGAQDGQGEDAGDEAAEDEKIEVQLNESSSTILHKSNARLFFQDPHEKKWKDRGLGTVTVRQPNKEETTGKLPSPFIVFTMDSGRIALNASLYKGIKAQLGSKPEMLLVTLFVQDVSEDEPAAKASMQMVLFKQRTAESAKELLSAIMDNAPA